MHKDSKGNYLTVDSVVVLEVGLSRAFYTVKGFDMKRDYFVELANGCVKCYAKPDQITCISYEYDLIEGE